MSPINIFKTPEKTAEALAFFLKDKINGNANFFLAISGGSTPKLLFKALKNIKKEIAWQNLQLFWVDERCVSPLHEESNFRMTAEHLLRHIPLSRANVHRMRGELPPEEGLKDYAKAMRCLPRSNDLPQFDLVILGMGDDGHTASIFPTEKELISVEKDLAIGTNPYSGQKRLSLTGRTINNAKAIIFHLSGGNKAKVLHEVLNEMGQCKNYPAFYFKGKKTTWWMDETSILKD